MYKQSSEEERVKSNETREILVEEMIFDRTLSVGRIWTCTDGLEGHSAASEGTAGKKEGQIGGIPRMPTAVSTKIPLL